MARSSDSRSKWTYGKEVESFEKVRSGNDVHMPVSSNNKTHSTRGSKKISKQISGSGGMHRRRRRRMA